MHARKPPPTVDECIIASAEVAATARRRLATLQLILGTLQFSIESSANAIRASQTLLANLQADKNSR